MSVELSCLIYWVTKSGWQGVYVGLAAPELQRYPLELFLIVSQFSNEALASVRMRVGRSSGKGVYELLEFRAHHHSL